MTELTIGAQVENFEAPSTGDVTFQLSDYQGKNVILYFYPKDNTPGCTLEGREFRDHYPQFQALNTEIFGISRDSVRVHENFKAKQEFPFELLSDKEEQLCQQFDVIKMKNMYGKQVRGIERSTFLIDSNGILQHEWRKVKVKTHIAEVLETVQTMVKG